MAGFAGPFPTEFVNGAVLEEELYRAKLDALDASDNDE